MGGRHLQDLHSSLVEAPLTLLEAGTRSEFEGHL